MNQGPSFYRRPFLDFVHQALSLRRIESVLLLLFGLLGFGLQERLVLFREILPVLFEELLLVLAHDPERRLDLAAGKIGVEPVLAGDDFLALGQLEEKDDRGRRGGS